MNDQLPVPPVEGAQNSLVDQSIVAARAGSLLRNVITIVAEFEFAVPLIVTYSAVGRLNIAPLWVTVPPPGRWKTHVEFSSQARSAAPVRYSGALPFPTVTLAIDAAKRNP